MVNTFSYLQTDSQRAKAACGQERWAMVLQQAGEASAVVEEAVTSVEEAEEVETWETIWVVDKGWEEIQ